MLTVSKDPYSTILLVSIILTMDGEHGRFKKETLKDESWDRKYIYSEGLVGIDPSITLLFSVFMY